MQKTKLQNNDEQLIDIAKNYKEYNYSNADFLDTINVLNSRNISHEALRNEGVAIPENIDKSENILDGFKSYSKRREGGSRREPEARRPRVCGRSKRHCWKQYRVHSGCPKEGP